MLYGVIILKIIKNNLSKNRKMEIQIAKLIRKISKNIIKNFCNITKTISKGNLRIFIF